MSHSTKNKSNTKNRSNLLDEIVTIISICLSIFLTICIYTDSGGILGNIIGIVFKGMLGIGAYIIPVVIAISGIYMISNKIYVLHIYDINIAASIMWIFISLIHMNNTDNIPPYNCTFIEFITFYFRNANWNNGGLMGAALGNSLLSLFGKYGAYLFLYSILLILIILFTKKPIFQNADKYFVDIKKKIDQNNKYIDSVENKSYNIKYGDDIVESVIPASVVEDIENTIYEASENVSITENVESKSQNIVVDGKKLYRYVFPYIEILNRKAVKSVDRVKLEIEMKQNALKLERTLKSFGVIATVLDICKGPTVTRYELQPKEGVKVSKIVNLSDDIALNLAATGLRIEAPIPGKSAIGIEIPNSDIQQVYLREILESREFKNFNSKLAFGVGRDIAGNIIVADIAQMPHTLIAGATGSGKSVCINTLITSILYKANPTEVKLIMIDPKVVELSVYNGIPHLLIPVVTDANEAASALNWAVQEMMSRYKLFAENSVRDIKGYNESILDKKGYEPMPEMVIIIDELADLMMASPKNVEDSICRLAQMARAAGIHLIIATQRPSVDIITGVIKANIPSRIAFAVSSGIDSRTILDMVGAEKLLGKGDMLFYPSGAAKPTRVQGAFISDKEVENVVKFIKENGKAEYDQDIIEKISADENRTKSKSHKVLISQK